MSLRERTLLAMSAKAAQRRSAADLASGLGVAYQEMVTTLADLGDEGLAHRRDDGGWSLTVEGNAARNRLTRAAAPRLAPVKPEHVYAADVLAVHDGDTYTLRVDLGFKCAVTIQCRLHGVDTPELDVDRKPNPAGLAARDFVRGLLMPSSHSDSNPPVIVESYKDARSFERWVCDVWLPDGRSLAQALLDAGHAVPMGR